MLEIKPKDVLTCRSVWISDVHLGSKYCKAKQLLQFLDRIEFEQLYLVGDIVDLLAMQKRVHWPPAHNNVISRFMKLARRKNSRVIGDFAYTFMMWTNTKIDQIRDQFGLPYWSLAKWVKRNSKKAEEAIDAYQLTAINMIKNKNYDGIICGHLHYPTIRELDGVRYLNDGDWVENCSALIELSDGQIRLIKGISHPESVKEMIFVDATDEFTR